MCLRGWKVEDGAEHQALRDTMSDWGGAEPVTPQRDCRRFSRMEESVVSKAWRLLVTFTRVVSVLWWVLNLQKL